MKKSNFIYGRYFGEYDVERSVSLEVTPEAGLAVNKENEGTSVTLGF